MAVLKANVALRRGNAIEVLLAGETLPSWAEGLVGEHALVDEPSGYGSKTVVELRELIDERGIEVDATKKADLVAALEAADSE